MFLYYVFNLYAIWAVEKTTSLTLEYNYPEGYVYEPGTDEKVIEDISNLGTVDLTTFEPDTGNDELTITVNGVTYKFMGWSTSASADEASIRRGCCRSR